MRNKLGLMVVLVLILLPTSSFAFNCDLLNGKAYSECVGLQDEVDEELHDLIVSNFVYSQSYFPTHDLIYDWNTNVDFVVAPDNVEVYEGEWIKGAWMKIFAVMPSVYENEELYAPENITILAPYYFDVEIPDNYEAYSDGETSHGDCKREYVVNSNSSIFSVYVNSYYVGNNITTSALIDRDSTISAVLDVNTDVDIYRYKWDKECIEYDEDDDCIEYEYECEFDDVENIEDSFTISDELMVNFYHEIPQANFTVVDKYSDNVKIRPWIDANTNGVIGFTEGYYYEYNTFYDVVYGYPPYYILTLRSNDYAISGKQGIFLDDGDIIFKSSNDCILYYWNHFTLNTSVCNIDSEIQRPTIRTDRLVYNVNDTITVYVEPVDELILVTYANETKNITGSTTFNAKHLQNRITAQIGEHKSSVSINVTKGNKLPVLFDFSVFFTIMLVFYRSIKAGLLGVGI